MSQRLCRDARAKQGGAEEVRGTKSNQQAADTGKKTTPRCLSTGSHLEVPGHWMLTDFMAPQAGVFVLMTVCLYSSSQKLLPGACHRHSQTLTGHRQCYPRTRTVGVSGPHSHEKDKPPVRIPLPTPTPSIPELSGPEKTTHSLVSQ